MLKKIETLIAIILAVINGVEYTPPIEKSYENYQYEVHSGEVPQDREVYLTLYKKIYNRSEGEAKSKSPVEYPVSVQGAVTMNSKKEGAKLYAIRPYSYTYDYTKDETLPEDTKAALKELVKEKVNASGKKTPGYNPAMLHAVHWVDYVAAVLSKDLKAEKFPLLPLCHFTVVANVGKHTNATVFYFPSTAKVYNNNNAWDINNPSLYVNAIANGNFVKEFDYFQGMYPQTPSLGQNITFETPMTGGLQIKVTYGCLSHLWPDWSEDHRNDPYIYEQSDFDKLRPSLFHGLTFTPDDQIVKGQMVGIVGKTGLPAEAYKSNRPLLDLAGLDNPTTLAEHIKGLGLGNVDAEAIAKKIIELSGNSMFTLKDIVRNKDIGFSALMIQTRTEASEYTFVRWLYDTPGYETEEYVSALKSAL